ncbi:MAG: hypothetical protein A2X86_18075 [Bdellovibrionales bacterium GWA2_49_15]|nr:MAG: hypothetical protein A2X86_18075 [Bdellovibrionales bacterium GWA2_49_15]HAZ11633.1 hypothetical protein [Bdellovibrionales bacterium]
MKVLYFHGAPFFNSNPEKNILVRHFQAAGFELKLWNESSTLILRENAFQTYLDSAERFLLENYTGEPLVLVGHSFGSHPVCHLVQKHSAKLSKVFFITPNLDLAAADIGMFTVAMNDFMKHADDRWLGLQEVLKNYSGNFDQNNEAGFGFLAQNPRFFDCFWLNKERMAAFLPFYAEPGCGMDVVSFLGVRQTMVETTFRNSQIPAVAIFGKHDVVITQDKQLPPIQQRFANLEVHELENSAHYPHIEETDKFLEILARVNFVNKKAHQEVGLHA